MSPRTVADHLRDEYFSLLPHIRDVTEELEAEIRYLLIPLMQGRERHERIVVKSRVKECESAINALMRRQEIWRFVESGSTSCTLRTLNDLAGVRILAFPRYRVTEIDGVIRNRFNDWTSDPVPATPGTTNLLALKYHGYCSRREIRAEIQVMSLLIGMYWEIEHAALYKPGDRLRGMEISLKMQQRNSDVIRALNEFEMQFESLVGETPSGTREGASH